MTLYLIIAFGIAFAWAVWYALLADSPERKARARYRRIERELEARYQHQNRMAAIRRKHYRRVLE